MSLLLTELYLQIKKENALFEAGGLGSNTVNPFAGVSAIEMALKMLQDADMTVVCQACFDRSKFP